MELVPRLASCWRSAAAEGAVTAALTAAEEVAAAVAEPAVRLHSGIAATKINLPLNYGSVHDRGPYKYALPWNQFSDVYTFCPLTQRTGQLVSLGYMCCLLPQLRIHLNLLYKFEFSQ